MMSQSTAALWAKQDQHEGDRLRLFSAVADFVGTAGFPAVGGKVLYPGSYVDVAPSFVFDSVTYLDMDKRAAAFFEDTDGVREIIAANGGSAAADFAFLHADYASELDLPDQHFDLLVSLYAGFISTDCTQHLKIGGTLLVNPSHGDAAMASIDPRYELCAAVISRAGDYRVDTSNLSGYLVPKKDEPITVESLQTSGRGVGYTKPAFAYLFTRVS